MKMATRSPLKETDANLKQRSTTINEHIAADGEYILGDNTEGMKKRKLGRIESQDRKKFKAERARSIEGAVQVTKTLAMRNIEPKVTPNELLEWQNNWKKIMRRESRIYFDSTAEGDSNKYTKNKMDKRKDLLNCGFLSLGAQITQFFDCSVTIVITRRSTDSIHLLPESDILSRAKKNYMKIWGYEKATRFLKNLDVDLDHLEKTKTTSLATPTLSNLLQNEKLYGPTDRDPRTRRDDIHYFKYAHVYMYDLWQTWAPIITLEWKPQELVDLHKLPYPVLKMGTFGRCPFVGDGSCDEASYKRTVKRYNRDKANKNYALKLRGLYQCSAEPSTPSQNLITIPHKCLDSKQSYENWQRKLMVQSEAKENITNDTTKEWITASREVDVQVDLEQSQGQGQELEQEQEQEQENEQEQEQEQEQQDTHYTPVVIKSGKRQLPTTMTALARQETEEFPDDLCNSKKLSRIPQEIKASGVHQSNDVATSFGNGLGPTKASVMNKNIKTLSRLVVDRRLGTKTANTLPPSNALALQTAGTSGTNIQSVANQENAFTKRDLSVEKKKRKVEHSVTTAAKRDTSKNAGYCENCRVKYDSLEQHILTEKHQSFAQNDLNFELIDSLIEKLKFQF